MKKPKKSSYHHGDLRSALIKRACRVIKEEGIEALSLRRLARDLNVSHGAPNKHFKNKLDLLSGIAADGYYKLTKATLKAANDTGSEDSWIRLNAAGKGFMRWAFLNQSSFRAITHPDIGRLVSKELNTAIGEFQSTLRKMIIEAHNDGLHSSSQPLAVRIFTTAVPFGALMLMMDPILGIETTAMEREQLVEQITELAVPIKGR